MNRNAWCLPVLLASLLSGWSLLSFAADLPGSKDHPMVSRYEGSEILKYETRAFDKLELLSGAVSGRKDAPEPVPSRTAVEGKLTRIAYRAPENRSSIEVLRNYEQALTAGGFKILFACEQMQCDVKGGESWGSKGGAFNRAATPKDMFAQMFGQEEEQRYLLAKLARAEGDVYASLYVVNKPQAKRVFANLIVVESQPMQANMVKVDAAAISKGLDAEGHIALYEVYFDTGKADLKPESDAALAEIAGLLKDKPALKVLVVGHTDNVGELVINQTLSERRAKSVVQALAGKQGIARDRLTAVGVGMAAPVASNDSEPGRAKNRRVELVKR